MYLRVHKTELCTLRCIYEGQGRMKMKCKKCIFQSECICIPDSDECNIRTKSYNQAIDDFAQITAQKAKAEMDDCADELKWIEEIAEQLRY